MTTVRTQTIEILRLFCQSRNILFEVFRIRNAILAAEIAEKPFGLQGSAPDPAGELTIAGRGARCHESQEPLPAAALSASNFVPLLLRQKCL